MQMRMYKPANNTFLTDKTPVAVLGTKTPIGTNSVTSFEQIIEEAKKDRVPLIITVIKDPKLDAYDIAKLNAMKDHARIFIVTDKASLYFARADKSANNVNFIFDENAVKTMGVYNSPHYLSVLIQPDGTITSTANRNHDVHATALNNLVTDQLPKVIHGCMK